MELLYFFLTLITLHYAYFIGSIYLGLVNLRRKQRTRQKVEESTKYFVSIIIPFRNEADVILQNLRSVEQLNYPKDSFEVIYVDDNSEDNSFDLIKQNIQKTNISVVKLPDNSNHTANKKKAIEYGISLSKGEIIFTSDADCTYNSDWINTMIATINDKVGLVAGPVDFAVSNSVLSRIQQIEHAGLILTGAGLIGISNPIICSGANIAFRKELFYKIGGYSGYSKLASGDDSFLMTKLFYDTEYEVQFCFNKAAMVETQPSKNIREFLNQRKRWVGKAFFYRKKRILLQVVLLALFLIFLPVELILGLIGYSVLLYFFFGGLIVKIIFEYLVMYFGSQTIYESEMMKLFWLAEAFHIPYTIFASLSGIFGKFNWKGRVLKK